MRGEQTCVLAASLPTLAKKRQGWATRLSHCLRPGAGCIVRPRGVNSHVQIYASPLGQPAGSS